MFNLIGVRNVNFTDRVTGNQISGNTIYVTCPEENVLGVSGRKYFVSNRIDISQISIGDNIEIFFNDKGKVQSIIKVK